MRYRSDLTKPEPVTRRSRIALGLIGLLAILLAVPAVRAAADVVNTGRYVLTEDAVQTEDVYVASSSATIDGRIEGDLVIASSDVSIGGTVTGDVLVAVRDQVTVTGTIEGSLRGVARVVDVQGSVADDVAVAAWTLDITGEVGRDVIAYGVSTNVEGSVGRDVVGRYYGLGVAAMVGRDVDVAAERLTMSVPAALEGDLVYKSPREATIADGVLIAGQVIEIPADASFFVGLVLELALLVGFLGYLAGGIALLWLFRSTSARGVAAVARRPWRTLAVGAVAVLLAGPLLLGVLIASFVGVPLAVIVLVAMVAGLLFGTVPAAAAAGWKILGGRGGVYGGFVAVAIVWRLIAEVVPMLGAVLFATGLLWGVGGWLTGAWQARRAATPAVTESPSPEVPLSS